MNKLSLTILLLLGLATLGKAQWTSPGNGSTFDLDALVENSDGCVVRIGKLPYSMDRPVYRFISDVTIAPTDRLVFPDFVFIEFDDVTLTIQGALTIEGTSFGSSSFVDKSHENPDAHPCIRFEDATDASIIKACVFLAFSGIKIINSEVTFDDCVISYFDTELQSSAVNYMNCDPLFTDCHFYNNEGPAIGSAVNVFGSPQILNCQFTNNVTSNANQPQINLGPGSNDTIRIVGCTVKGLYDRVGGITIADMADVGDTKILLKDNIVKDNRYGYNQQGYSLSSVVTGNQFIDNNRETNPDNGGSGISIYGGNESNKAKLRNNLITGNLWGITAIYYHDIDMGTDGDWGQNLIYGNGNNGIEYALYDNGFSDISAIGNYWGGSTEDFVESVIFHRPDLGGTYGLVDYLPFLTDDGTTEQQNFGLQVTYNPASQQIVVNTEAMDVRLFVYNALGQKVFAGRTFEGSQSIGTAGWPQGIYIVNMGAQSGKVVVY